MTIVQMVFGLVVGFLFGYILSRTGITKYPRVMGMLLLKDFKILKFMLTAVTSSMLIFYALAELDLMTLNPKALDWGKVVGGLAFGTGMGHLGYCPGTMGARIGEGKREALLALVGMAFGIFLYALFFSPLKEALLSSEISGDISFLLGVNHWMIVLPAAVLFSAIIYAANHAMSDDKVNF